MRPKYLLTPAALLLVAGGFYFWNLIAGIMKRRPRPPRARASSSSVATMGLTRERREGKFDKRKRLFNPDVVQVVVEPVRQSDFPIYLSGLGTVIAYNTVDVKAQVDGTILRMNFVEGQDVKIGDPLVTLDPALYQAKVEQYQGLKAKAVAQLENAKSNLWRDQQLLTHNFATQKQTDAQQALVDEYTANIAEYEAEIKYCADTGRLYGDPLSHQRADRNSACRSRQSHPRAAKHKDRHYRAIAADFRHHHSAGKAVSGGRHFARARPIWRSGFRAERPHSAGSRKGSGRRQRGRCGDRHDQVKGRISQCAHTSCGRGISRIAESWSTKGTMR